LTDKLRPELAIQCSRDGGAGEKKTRMRRDVKRHRLSLSFACALACCIFRGEINTKWSCQKPDWKSVECKKSGTPRMPDGHSTTYSLSLQFSPHPFPSSMIPLFAALYVPQKKKIQKSDLQTFYFPSRNVKCPVCLKARPRTPGSGS
jgi:hypothetical protein